MMGFFFYFVIVWNLKNAVFSSRALITILPSLLTLNPQSEVRISIKVQRGSLTWCMPHNKPHAVCYFLLAFADFKTCLSIFPSFVNFHFCHLYLTCNVAL